MAFFVQYSLHIAIAGKSFVLDSLLKIIANLQKMKKCVVTYSEFSYTGNLVFGSKFAAVTLFSCVTYFFPFKNSHFKQ